MTPAKITPFLWFKDLKAEEALNYYIQVFRQGEIVNVMRYTDSSVGPIGGFMAGVLRIFGQEIFGLNGNNYFEFTPATSLFVLCDSQAEIDRYWDGLSAGGNTMACGWLTDKYGVTWQIVPRSLSAMLADPDPIKAGKVGQAMMSMIKFDMAALEAAYLS